jgi:hypothetical protein
MLTFPSCLQKCRGKYGPDSRLDVFRISKTIYTPAFDEEPGMGRCSGRSGLAWMRRMDCNMYER